MSAQKPPIQLFKIISIYDYVINLAVYSINRSLHQEKKKIGCCLRVKGQRVNEL